MLFADDVDVAGGRHEYIADSRRLLHFHHLETVHVGLQRAKRVDLGDDDVGAEPFCAHGDAFAAPAVPREDERGACEKDVRCAQDSVDRALACAVPVVEHMFCQRVIDRDDGELEDALELHALEPDNARGRLFHRPDHVADERLTVFFAELLHPFLDDVVQGVHPVKGDHVEGADKVRAVIHRNVGHEGKGLHDVLVVLLVRLALDRISRDAEMLHDRRRDIVLRAQGVRRAQDDLGPGGLQCLHQVRRFRRHVEAAGDPDAFQRFLPCKPLRDLP